MLARNAIDSVAKPPRGTTLSVVSANIQAGASTRSYRDYVSRPWSHVLPHPEKRSNLDIIAGAARAFDIVGLQETDPGSLRSGFLNQTHYLAEAAGFEYWSHQSNRSIGGIMSSANGLLSRRQPDEVRDYALPGRVAGRGVLWARYGHGTDALIVLISHLSLGMRSRADQLGFIVELLSDAPHAVFMGDFNCEAQAPEMRPLYDRCGFVAPTERLPSFPSWQPRRAIDHILVTPGIQVRRRWVLPGMLSDHIAVAAELELPNSLQRPDHSA
ncbi:MAG: endonuclease/exonuclease/phosphatase family protein [Pseudomarimonas sp.]